MLSVYEVHQLLGEGESEVDPSLGNKLELKSKTATIEVISLVLLLLPCNTAILP
jgi:hypothetical protein